MKTDLEKRYLDFRATVAIPHIGIWDDCLRAPERPRVVKYIKGIRRSDPNAARRKTD